MDEPRGIGDKSCRSMAEVCGISKASVQRVWHANGLKPNLLKGTSKDRDLREFVRV